MKPLLEIRNIPISIEYKVNNAEIRRTSGQTELEITKNKGGYTMKSRPIKLNIDSFEARNSVSKSPARSIDENAEIGQKAAYEATARFAEEGKILLDIHLNSDPITQIAEMRMNNYNHKDFVLSFIPDSQAELNWQPGDLTVQYELDKLNINWKTNTDNIEFIPANIEFNIKEYPRVVIEYIGSPIYVPPSADPNYEPVDTKV